jgi:hypothetical protein
MYINRREVAGMKDRGPTGSRLLDNSCVAGQAAWRILAGIRLLSHRDELRPRVRWCVRECYSSASYPEIGVLRVRSPTLSRNGLGPFSVDEIAETAGTVVRMVGGV